MPNPALNWRYLGSAATGGTIDGALDAIYNLGVTSTYWSWSRDTTTTAGVTEAVYGGPTGINPLNMQYIIAGRFNLSFPVYASPDTGPATNSLVAGMNRNSGAYAGWEALNPFTTASSFSGYWKTVTSFATTAWATVHMWDSQEACIVQILSPTAPNPGSVIAFGALFDPLVYNSGITCESDDRLYALCTGGSTATYSPLGATWLSQSAAGGSTLGGSANLDGGSHSGFFIPGTNLLFQMNRLQDFTPGAGFVNLAGNAVVHPINVRWGSDSTTGAVFLQSGWFAGRSRNFGIIKDTTTARTWTIGAVTQGYTLAYSSATAGDAVALLY
jgi:hypothetical protein